VFAACLRHFGRVVFLFTITVVFVCTPELENLYIFFIIDSKDIKGKLLTIIDRINLYGMYVYAAIGHKLLWKVCYSHVF